MPQPTTTREAKECFVLSDKAKVLANRDVSSFQKELVALKDVVHRMTNPQLDSVLDWRDSRVRSPHVEMGNCHNR